MVGKVFGIATLSEFRLETRKALQAFARHLGAVEVRADLFPEVEPDRIHEVFSGVVIWTLRSRREGGSGPDFPEKRKTLILEAAARFDWIDLEVERDLVPEILAAIEPDRRVLSWHGTAADSDELYERWQEMAKWPARCYKLVVHAQRPGETCLPFELLLTLTPQERAKTVSFAMGSEGVWTRLLAPRIGAPYLYGYLGERPAASGQLSWERLFRDYGFPDLLPASTLFGVVGSPVLHSLSPRLHNAGYRAQGISAFFVPFETTSFSDFWLDVVESGWFDRMGLPLRGLAVTTPFKELAVAVAGAVSPLADQIEAANSLVFQDGVWEADTTDGEGVVGAVRARGVSLAGRTALVLGVGGAGRAAAVGLSRRGACVEVTNRDPDRGRQIANRLRVSYRPFAELDWKRYSLVVNATPLGRSLSDPHPAPLELLSPNAVLVDLVYGEEETGWLREARQRGFLAIDGREVLLYQARPQFERMTGQELPLDLGRELLGLGGER